MVFPPGPIAPPEHQLDESSAYRADQPFPLKQSNITHARRRWFDVRDIATAGAQPGTQSPGLNAGASQRIQYEHKPDVIIVSLHGASATTATCHLYLGDGGGPFIRLGALGRACIPGTEYGVITLVNVGSTILYGTVIAVAGYENMPRIDLNCGGWSGATP